MNTVRLESRFNAADGLTPSLAAEIARRASQYNSHLSIEAGGKAIRVESLISILSMELRRGLRLSIIGEGVDAQAAAADSMVKPDQQDARIEAWRKIFITAMDDAPWVPVFNEKRYTVHSARMGGEDALYVDPVHVPVNYDYIGLK